ncbi:MAG TPA: ATP-binding protein [Methylococcaceae bacterium]|nr:ATP-binding protein [Methylococcaceae bacterium]
MPLQRARQLEWLYELYRLGQSHVFREQPAEGYRHILKHVVAGFDGATGSLALRRDAEALVIVACVGLPEEVVGSVIPKGYGILGRVAEDGAEMLLNGDLSGDARFSSQGTRTSVTRPSSAMCWPLKMEGGVIGAISINRLAGTPPFTPQELEHGTAPVSLISIVVENARLHLEQQRQIHELEQAYRRLQDMQGQLLQSEKMASIGQLAAGVAHEINNPIGYVSSNLGTLQKYIEDIFALLDAYAATEGSVADESLLKPVRELKARIDLPFVREDVGALMHESQDGIGRVKRIVQDLKDFSHAGSEEDWQWADLRKGIDSTLNIVWNEIKYKAEVVKEYGELPDVECLPSQINQVFMNLLVNASHAIAEQGVITIRTGMKGDQACVEIADTGAGIAPEHLARIFDPFFTTKPVGKGTGLGLSLSYSIVQKHGGKIEVESEVGKGTTFRILLPVKPPDAG